MSYGVYAIWDANNILQAASPKQYDIYKPDDESEITFEELRSINSDAIGWLTIYGTKIDYPIMRAEDNNKYLTMNPQGKYSLAGSIFMDYRNDASLSDLVNIIYGHHLSHDMMFGDISDFKEESYFDEHKYGNLYCDGRDQGIEFFAFIEVDVYKNNLYSLETFAETDNSEYLEEINRLAMYTRSIDISPGDRLVVLSTCTVDITNGRHILIGRLVDRVYEDAFDTEKIVNKQPYVGLLTTEDRWIHGMLYGIFITICILVLLSMARNRKMRRISESNQKNTEIYRGEK